MAVLTGLSLTGCSEDDLGTNQYQGGNIVSLNVWGPNPVMYGGTIMFKGSNLEQVSQIILPGCDPITNIEVVRSGVPSDIRITVPTEAFGTDYVTLITNTGQEIVTSTEISFEQGMELKAFSPASVMPGETLTVTGEYLQLAECIQFSEEVYVSKDDFVSQGRNEIQVIVPEDARTGIIYLLDLDVTKYTQEDLNSMTYNAIPSEDALEVGTPAVASLSSPRGEAEALGTVTAKAGETVTITGSYLNLVSSLKFGDEDSETGVSEMADFTVDEKGETLTLTLPSDAPDGDINLVCKSGVEVPAGVLVTVGPSNCVATPSPVKAGAALTVTGSDMDVVTSVEMPNVSDGIDITVSESAVVITAVPTTAQEGSLVLRMANGKGVEVAFTLVKPAVTGYENNPVSAGGALTMYGTDLDLVTGVQFGEDSDVAEVEVSADGTSLTLTVPMNAATGSPTLLLANGTSVDGLELTVEEAVFCYATALPGDDEELQAGGTLTLTIVNGDKLTGVEVNGSAAQYVLANGSQLIIGLPDTAGANTAIRLISSNGEITYTVNVTPQTEVNTVIWEGMVDLGSWSINWQFGDNTQSTGESATAFADIDLAVGDVIHLYATAYNDWWQIQFFNGHWEGQTSIGETFGNGNNVNSDIASLAGGCLDITVTETMLYELTTYTDWGYCWIIQGEGVIITKISVTHYNSLEQDLANCIVKQDDQTALMPFPIAMSWDDSGRFRILIDGTPSIKDMNLKAGSSTIYFYVSGTGQLQINDGNWSSFTTLSDWEDSSAKAMELVLTSDMIAWLKGETSDGWSSTGLIVQGDGFTLSKVTILP